MRKLTIALTLLLVGVILVAPATAIRWPMGDGATPYPLGNSYGTYQNYGGSSYWHDGLDPLGYAGEPNYNVEDNYLVLKQNNDPLYSGIMTSISNGPGNGWAHWHLTFATIPFNVGDYMYVDDYIGNIANWPTHDFHHNHFARIYFTGSWYQPIGNPLDYLAVTTDPAAPVFRNARGTHLFAFRSNTLSSPTYYSPSDLSGEVDIVALVGDKSNHNHWDINPYRISYWIEGDGGSVPETLTVEFTGPMFADNVIHIIHSNDSTCYTRGNYNYRDFYYIVTNTSGTGTVSFADQYYAWDTTELPDGQYTVYVKAVDAGGNETVASMQVTLNNGISNIELISFDAADRDEGLFLNWAVEGEYSAFTLERRRGDAEWKSLHERPITATAFLDTGADSGVEYEYRLMALDASGHPTVLGTLNARLDAQVPTRFVLSEPWPNPAINHLNVYVDLPEAADLTLELYDIAGRRITSQSVPGAVSGRHNLSVDVNDLAPGVYLLRAFVGEESGTRRVVITR